VDALPLIAIAAVSFTVALAGGVAGLVLGNLRLPLVVLFASSPSAAAATNVAISGAAAAAAAGAHVKARRINWRLFTLMAPPSILGGFLGGLASGRLPERVLLAAIAVVVFYGAYEIWRLSSRSVAAPGAGPSGVGGQALPADPSRGEPVTPGTGSAGLRPAGSGIRSLPAAITGLVVGVLGGVVGLILGTLRLPAMLRWVGADTRDAVATNSAIGLTLAIGAVLGHLGSGVDWDLAAAGAGAAIPGALIGARFVGRLAEETLLRAVAAILVVSGVGMAVAAGLR
jgi:uncharacterized membrane protein YfcA